MSEIHTMIFDMIMKGRSVYDPDNRPDYTARRKQEEEMSAQSPLPEGTEFSVGELGNVPVEYISCGKNRTDRIVFYIHGGGFVSGSSRQSRNITGYVAAELGFNVISADYRLAPEHPFPAGAEDCFAVYRALLEEYPAEKIAFMGGSAGGNLVLSAALMAKDRGLPLPACIVTASPTLQYTKDLESYKKNAGTDCMITNLAEEVKAEYFQSSESNVLENPYGAPLSGDFHGFPPVLVNVSGSEVLYDDAVLLDRRLKEQGVRTVFLPRSGMMHGYIFLPVLPEAQEDLKAVQSFISECFGE